MARLHLDVLELVFAYLHDADLVAAALVCRDFLSGALPAIYAAIEYTIRHAKRANSIVSPFATLRAHPHLAVHVRRIAVHAAPIFRASSHSPNPIFLFDLAHTLRATTNLRAFVCTVNILPPLLPHLVDKRTLHNLRISAAIGSRQCAVLQETSGLHSLSLDFPSWNVIDALPKWSASMQRTLAHLTLFMSQDLDTSMFNAILTQLPRLRGLHVIACPLVTHSTVLKALEHTPDLIELSLTIFPSQENKLPTLNFPIPPLTHLSIDIRASYPILKSFIARIISRLSPRVALAICGGWIGEIRSSTESADSTNGSNDPTGADSEQNAPMHAHANNQHEDPPLLTPALPHHVHAHVNHLLGQPTQANQPHPPHFSFSFGFFPGNPNGNSNGNGNGNSNGNGPPGPPNLPGPDPDHSFNLASLIGSLPSTLTILHLPLLSPAALKEVVERCEGIQVLGIVIGSAFGSPNSGKSTKTTGHARSAARSKHASITGVRPEVILLASILSRARSLEELIVDTSDLSISESNADSGTDAHGAFRGTALLTPSSVRMLMRESPLLRRVVGEGRVWMSSTPTPTSPIPFPQCLTIDLTLTKARYGPGASNHHAYGPPGFGTPGGGYAHVETENDHWFWLKRSESGGKVYSRF